MYYKQKNTIIFVNQFGDKFWSNDFIVGLNSIQ